MAPRAEIKALTFIFSSATLLFLLYLPGLKGPFVLDDFYNLEALGYHGGVTSLTNAGRFVFGNESGPTGRPVAMASFLLDDFTWPSSPYEFKKTNLVFHFLVGLVLFLVLYRLFFLFGDVPKSRIFMASALASLIWLIHPLQTSTVLYVVQRMAILSTFFSLAAVYIYLYLRDFKSFSLYGYLPLLILFSAFFVLAVFSKENALLILLFIIGLEIYLRRKAIPLTFRNKQILVIVFLVVAALFLKETYYIWGKAYPQREFGLLDRAFSQILAIGDYVLKIIFPIVSEINLYNGEFENYPKIDFSLSEYLKGTITVLLLVIFVSLPFYKAKSLVIPWIGLFWFFVFHLMESTILPLELYFEHRNYLPSIGLILVMTYMLVRWSAASSIKAIVVISLIVFLSFQTSILANTWSNPHQLYLKWEMDEPKSARAKLQYSHLLFQQGFPENSVEYIEDALEYKPSSLTLKINNLFFSCINESNRSVEGALDKFSSPNSFDLGTTASLKTLIENLRREKLSGCDFDNVNLENLFSIIEASFYFGDHKNHTAQYYSLKSDYYAMIGDLNSSAQALDLAIKTTPTTDLYFKSADMLASAGLYHLALERLDQALKIERSEVSSLFSRQDELLKRRKQIETMSRRARQED